MQALSRGTAVMPVRQVIRLPLKVGHRPVWGNVACTGDTERERERECVCEPCMCWGGRESLCVCVCVDWGEGGREQTRTEAIV